MTDNLRDRIAAAIYSKAAGWDDFPFDDLMPTFKAMFLEQADAVIEALDRDYIIVTPGTPLAQKILEWQLTDV